MPRCCRRWWQCCLGNSTRVSVGPAALTCLLVAASLTGLAQPGSAHWVALAVWLAILSGLMQLALGAGGFGWVLNLISCRCSPASLRRPRC
jgi:SulP family sulfate permease